MQRFCKDVPHGNGHAEVIGCLQSYADAPEMSASCQKQLLQERSAAARDFRLVPALQRNCRTDIQALCAEACDATKNEACGGRVVRCLREKRDQLAAPGCKAALKRVLKWQAQDWSSGFLLKQACAGDVKKLCGGVKSRTDGGVHRCLREHVGELSEACRAEESDTTLALNTVGTFGVASIADVAAILKWSSSKVRRVAAMGKGGCVEGPGSKNHDECSWSSEHAVKD